MDEKQSKTKSENPGNGYYPINGFDVYGTNLDLSLRRNGYVGFGDGKLPTFMTEKVEYDPNKDPVKYGV